MAAMREGNDVKLASNAQMTAQSQVYTVQTTRTTWATAHEMAAQSQML